MNFGEAGAAIFRDVERDDLGHRFGVAMHAPEEAVIVGLGRPAPAGADRIDQHQIGEGEPGIGIVDEVDLRAIAAVGAEFGDARPDQPEIEERRCRARPAVEDECDRPRRRTVGLGDVSGVKNLRRSLARLIEQRECSGSRRIGKLAGFDVDRVLGDGIGRQQRENAGAARLTVAVGCSPWRSERAAPPWPGCSCATAVAAAAATSINAISGRRRSNMASQS